MAYISGPLQAASDLPAAREFYARLGEICRDAGFEPYLPHNRTDPETHSDTDSGSVFRFDLDALDRAAIVVAHIGVASSGVGAELGIAYHEHQSIIGIHRSNERPSRFIEGMLAEYPAARILEVANDADLETKLSAALRELGPMSGARNSTRAA